MSILERCPFYRESHQGCKERQGPNLGVHLIKVSVKREPTVHCLDHDKGFDSLRSQVNTVHFVSGANNVFSKS